MKVPINWLNELVNLPKDIKELTHKLTMVGHMLDKIEIKDGQTIIDLELRGNRADCYSIYGIAREVAAINKTKVKKIDIVPIKLTKNKSKVKLNVTTSLVKRVGMIEIRNVKIEKSPKWLADRLVAYGMESKNNIIDLTNYVMIETGEPMHAFDLDKIGNNLEIRMAKKNEKITTFQDNSLTLTTEDLVWSKRDQVLSVAGAVGEKHHSISETTKNILLEAANYERSNIRRTVYRHKLLTEAGIRHEKELDPNMVDFAIARFLYFIKKYNWGEFENSVYDYYPKVTKPWKINLSLNYLSQLSGVEINLNDIKSILVALGFKILKKDKTSLTVLVPTFRTDVVLEEDLIEEIVRIHGYDNIPTHTLSLEIPKNITPDYITQEEKIRLAATGVGFDECISLSFIKEKYKKDENVSLLNPPSPDTKYLRNTLFYNLYDATKKIVHERGEIAALFEVGKTYKKTKGKYLEERKVGFMFWKKEKNSFPEFKSFILGFFEKLQVSMPNFVVEPFNTDLNDSFTLKHKNNNIGYGGSYDNIYYIEINLDSILGLERKYKASLWPKYPPQVEDITLIIPDKTYVGEVVQTIKSVSNLITQVELKGIYENAYTFNLQYQHHDQTLNDQEVEKIRLSILRRLKESYNISLKN